MILPQFRTPAAIAAFDRTTLIATFITPLLLMHAHGIAEASMSIAALAFLLRSWARGDWTWLRSRWMLCALAWWAWMVVCSLPVPALGLGDGGLPSLGQGLMAIRFPLFAAALAFGSPSTPDGRRWLFNIMTGCVGYIAFNVVFQFIFGVNIYGVPPSWGVLLTGPFGFPRASPLLARILPPVLIPFAAPKLEGTARSKMGGWALIVGAMAVVVIIGQRIPVVLLGGALAVSALLIRRMRPVVLLAGVLAIALPFSFAVIAPRTFEHQVIDTERFMVGFATNPWGLMYTRAAEIGRQKPWNGTGFDGFRYSCQQPRYFVPTYDGSMPDGGGAGICWVHPHNFYLQALVDGGVPGVALFLAFGIACLVPLGRGLWRDPDPLRVGLFATLALQLWPVQSTSSFWSMPMGGWFYLLVGWAFAETYARVAPAAPARQAGTEGRPASAVT